MMRASLLRFSPVFVLATALVALGPFFAHDAQLVDAQSEDHYTIWSATLKVQSDSGAFGCSSDVGVGSFACDSSNLTNGTFSYAGDEYVVMEVSVSASDTLGFSLHREPQTGFLSDMSQMTLLVDGTPFPVADAVRNERSLSWTNTGLSWNVEEAVKLRLVRSYALSCAAGTNNLDTSLDTTGMRVFPGNEVLTVAWVNGPTDKRYVQSLIRWQKAGSGVWLNSNGESGNLLLHGTGQSFDITGLDNGVLYAVEVLLIAHNGNPHNTSGCVRSSWYANVGRPQEPPAGNEIWSATLTAGDIFGNAAGCSYSATGQNCPSNLTNNTFTFGGEEYRIIALIESADFDNLQLVLHKTIPDSLNNLVLQVDGRRLGLAKGIRTTVVNTNDQLIWAETGISWTVGDEIQLRLVEIHPPTEMTVTASGALREGGRTVNVYFTLDHPAREPMSSTLAHTGHGWAKFQGPRFVEGAGTAVMTIRVPDDSNDNNCRTLSYDVSFLDSGGVRFEDQVAFTAVDDDGAADACTGLLGSPYATELVLQTTEVRNYGESVRVTLLAKLNKPAVHRTDVSIADTSTADRRAGFSDAGDYYVSNTDLTIWEPNRNPKYENKRGGIHDWPTEVFIWDTAADSDTITLVATTDRPELNFTTTLHVGTMRQISLQGADGGEAPPTAVTLALDAATVAEDGGDVTLTATLDAPAPEDGVAGFLVAGADGTASEDIDFTMPLGIFIPGGQRSATAAISITDDDLDEADETVALSALFDIGTALLEDKITLTITDDDTAGVTVSAASPLAVDEDGSATYTVVLDSQPTADVTITPSSDDAGAATVSPASHTFTPSGWNTPLTFTVSGVADDDINDESVTVSHGVSSDDALYNNLLPSPVSAAVNDATGEQEQGEQSPGEKYADLITKMKEWRNDPCCASDKAHTDRWDRALLTFGETVADTTLTPMTATEAQGYADRGWNRWVEVAAALEELESGGQNDTSNQEPTVSSAIPDATIVSESGTHQVSLGGVFSDADNDSLTISAGSSNEAVATVTVAPDYSSLTVTAKSRGTATITVTASDGNGGTVSDTFTVRVKAAPVVASAIADVSGLEVDATQDVSLSGVFSDSDGDALTISATSSGEAIATATVAADQSKLTVAGVAEGTATITVTAEDSDGNRVSDAFAVSVEADGADPDPDPPTGGPTVTAPLDDISLEGLQWRQFSLLGVFHDPDGDELTFTGVSSNYGVVSAWVAGTTLTVVAAGTGTATITVTAEDPDGNRVSDAFQVTVRPAS